jgi:hypothetical protein
MPKDKLGENDKPEWAGPTATKFEKYVPDRGIAHRTYPLDDTPLS